METKSSQLALGAANQVADLFRDGFFDDRMVMDVAAINATLVDAVVGNIVSILEQELSYYDNPSPYESESYYVKAQAKADVLEDMISAIKREFTKPI